MKPKRTTSTKPLANAVPRTATTLELVRSPDESQAEALGRTLVEPAVNAASTMQSYQGFLGEGIDIMSTIDAIHRSSQRIKGGDLSDLEGMLLGQATALQTIFTSLARRAQVQTHQRHLEAFLGLALKAQAQSRATITALVDLKYPRQVAFVKQANISNGPQQVNNGGFETSTRAGAHAAERPIPQIKELEASDGQWLDTGAKGAAGGADPHMATVGKGNGAEERRRKGQGCP